MGHSIPPKWETPNVEQRYIASTSGRAAAYLRDVTFYSQRRRLEGEKQTESGFTHSALHFPLSCKN